MRKEIWVATAFLIALVAVAVLSCQKKEPKPVEKGEPIKIGAILPLTGDAAQWGIPPKNGIELAIEEVNENGGIHGRNLAAIIEDSEALPAKGVSAFNKLLAQGVDVVIGAVASSVTLSIAPIAEQKHVILISPASTNPTIADAGDFIFRVVPSDAYRGMVFAEYVFREEGITKVAGLYINNDAGVGNTESFRSRFLELGGEFLIAEAYPQGATDVRTQLTKLKQVDAEAIMIVSYPADTVVVMRQVKELGITLPLFFQTEAVEDPTVLREAGLAAEGAVYILPASASGDIPEKFAENYEKKFGMAPELFGAEGYDAMKLIAAAMQSLPPSKITSDGIRDYLYTVKDYSGASGIISFDSKGEVFKPMAIKRVVNGKPQVIKEM
jgi:branched-chain amino acid transport system substrate-binding protein